MAAASHVLLFLRVSQSDGEKKMSPPYLPLIENKSKNKHRRKISQKVFSLIGLKIYMYSLNNPVGKSGLLGLHHCDRIL